MPQLRVTTIYPTNRPDYNDWCKEFKVGIRHPKREGIDNANRIMQLWDSYMKTKEQFIKLTETYFNNQKQNV